MQLELVIEGAFDKTDWRNLWVLLSRSFGDSLQSISVNSASRFNDLVRATSRGKNTASRRLTLESLTPLPSPASRSISLSLLSS